MTVERAPAGTVTGPVAGAGADAGNGPAGGGGHLPERRIALVDLLDRLLAGGVVINGDLTLSIADVDLVRISLRVLISSVSGLDVLEPFRDE